jgi:colicin import membrane protein
MISLKDKLSKPGMPLSLGLHAVVLVASIVSFSSPRPFADAQEAIAVEVVDASAVPETMKGDQQAKPQPAPQPRVDRVAEPKEQNPPGEAKRQVNTAATPKPQEATAPEERKEQTAAVTPPPPPPMPRIVPPAPPRPAEPPKAASARPVPADTTDEEEEAEEITRQAQRKKAEEQRKLEEQRRADEARRREENRRAEEARRKEQQRQEQARAEAQRQDQQRREQEEARQREEQRRIAEAKAADERRKAEEARKAQEAARKAAEERRKREAEQEARNQATAAAARRALLASREPPQNSGNTGQQISRTPPSQGSPTASGQRMTPSDRAALAGMIADQIRRCWNVPVSGKPSVLPQVRMVLNEDGSLASQPVLINAAGDPTFRAVAESGMRAIRQCSPFRIPARFQPTYADWRSTIVQLNPDD